MLTHQKWALAIRMCRTSMDTCQLCQTKDIDNILTRLLIHWLTSFLQLFFHSRNNSIQSLSLTIFHFHCDSFSLSTYSGVHWLINSLSVSPSLPLSLATFLACVSLSGHFTCFVHSLVQVVGSVCYYVKKRELCSAAPLQVAPRKTATLVHDKGLSLIWSHYLTQSALVSWSGFIA